MLTKLKTWINDVFTEDDGVTICPVRSVAFGGTGYSFVCHAYQTFWQHMPFDMLTFSAGLSAILGVLGMYLKVNKKHEPSKEA